MYTNGAKYGVCASTLKLTATRSTAIMIKNKTFCLATKYPPIRHKVPREANLVSASDFFSTQKAFFQLSFSDFPKTHGELCGCLFI